MSSSSETKKFVENVTKYLDASDFPAARNLFYNENNCVYLKNNSWDLIPILCKNITNDLKENKSALVACSEELLYKLAKEANPEEAVLEFLGQMEEADNVKFEIILKSLKIIVCRDITNRVKSFEWILNSIRSYMVDIIEVDKFDELEQEEENHFNNIIKKIVNTFNSVLEFYKYFVGNMTEKSDKELHFLFSSRLLQMFDVIFPYIDIQLYPQLKLILLKIQNLTLQLIPNPMNLLKIVFYRSLHITESKPVKESKEKKSNEFEEESFFLNDTIQSVNPFEDVTIVSDLAYGLFFFSLLSEIEDEQLKLPMVYNPKYIMLSLIYVTVPFFETQTNSAVYNGLQFLHLLLDQLNDSLEKADLYFSCHKSLLIHLNNTMVFSQIEKNRKLALKCFKKYIKCFNWEGRYLLLLKFRSEVHHPGTLGFLIVLLKDFVSSFLEISPTNSYYNKFLKYYRGKLLFDIIKQYCYLTNGLKTDLVENADQIISSLNALQYFVLRDKENVTDIKHFIKKIYSDYLRPLKDVIESSKNYYEMKLKNLENENKENLVNKANSDIEIELSVKNETLPKLSKEEQKTAYQSCLNAVDLIHLLYNRLIECWRVYKVRYCSHKSEDHSTDFDRKSNSSDDQQYENNVREKILNASLQFVPIHGWSKESLSHGAEVLKYPGVTNGIFSNGGADLINYFYVQCNKNLKDYMIELSSNSKKYLEPKEFISISVETRLRMLIPYLNKWPQAIAIMSLPPNVPVALANLLTLIDDICYYAGDKSVDFNWYTRRVGLCGIYKMTELYMIQDKSADFQETWKFLDRILTEAIQVQEIISTSSEATTIAKDVASAAFTTARNILRLNMPR